MEISFFSSILFSAFVIFFQSLLLGHLVTVCRYIHHPVIFSFSSYILTCPSLNKRKIVKNISNYNLTQDEEDLLSLGMNFAVSSQKIPKVEIIASTESTARKLNKEDGQQLCTGVALILQKSKPPKSNISKKQHIALTNLKRNKNIVILPADKGNATVVMDRCEYKMKMKKLLDDEYTYKQLPNDPTTKIEKRLQKH